MGNFIQIVVEDERNVFRFGDSEIYYRRFDSQVYEKIRKRHTVNKGNDRRGNPRIIVDEKSINDELMDWIITGWKGIEHPITLEEVPCTFENKIALPSSIKTAITERADSEKTQQEEDDEKKTLRNGANTAKPSKGKTE